MCERRKRANSGWWPKTGRQPVKLLQCPAHQHKCLLSSTSSHTSAAPVLNLLFAAAEKRPFGGLAWTGSPGGLRPHCCLHVESLRILLAVETPLREGLDEEEDRRSALALLFRAAASVPFTHTGLARPGLWSALPPSRLSSTTCPEEKRNHGSSKPHGGVN